MMNIWAKFPYYENEELQVLGLPYVGDEVLMYIVLPQQQFGLADVEKKLTGKQLLAYIEQCSDQEEVEVSGLFSCLLVFLHISRLKKNPS